MAARRVLLLDHTARWSGGEIALFRFLAVLDKTRYTPFVVLGEPGDFADKLLGIGVETVIEPLGSAVGETRKDTLGAAGLARKAVSAGSALLGYAKRVAAIARRERCELIHCNSLKSDVYGLIAGRMSGLPVVWHVRDHVSPEYLPGIAVRGLRAAARRFPAHVICNSRSTRLSLFGGDDAAMNTAANRARFSVVEDCVDESFLAPAPPASRRTWREPGDTRPLHIGIIGRLTRWKGQHVFLAAAKIAAQKWHEAGNTVPLRFVIAGAALFGETEYEARIREQAGRDFADSAIEWRGNVANIPALLAELDIMAHASISPEPFGQVVIEAMAAGVPVVGTNGGGVADIIKSGTNGLLVPMNDADALADALITLLCDADMATRLTASGWQTVRDRYLPERTARQIEAVYAGLLAR